MKEPKTLHQLSRALERGQVLHLGDWQLRRAVTEEGNYVVERGDVRYPCEDLQTALATVVSLAGTLEGRDKL